MVQDYHNSVKDVDKHFMSLALREAEKAAAKDEVPVGAVAVKEGKVLARAHNIRETTQDPLGHAELLLLKKLSRRLKSWRMNEITVYVTLEPCLMCMGALTQSRIDRLVFAAFDPKRKGTHQIRVTSGICGREASKLLKDFFKKIRKE